MKVGDKHLQLAFTSYSIDIIEVTIKTFTVLGLYGFRVLGFYGYAEVTISPRKPPYNLKTLKPHNRTTA